MSKELTALQVIIENKGLNGIKEPVEIIESALKDLEEYKKCIDLKEASYVSTHKIVAVEEDTYKDLVKNSQALEIIKNKGLYWDISYQPYEERGDYRAWDNELYESVKLTKEEFDLLKEVLVDEK